MSLNYMIKNLKEFVRMKGLYAIIKKLKTTYSLVDVIGYYGYTLNNQEIPYNENDEKASGDQYVVNWIIPDLDVGSGGHLNIFRFISFLENMGLHNRIYLFESPSFKNDESFREFLGKYYSTTLTNENIEIYNDVENVKFAHAVVATGWQTAYFVRRFNNAISKFYFVQDFEPLFYSMGSEYLMAENTYKFGFRGITAGDWLKDKLSEEYGMVTDSFGFSYDKDLYVAKEKNDSSNRLFFYARPVTPRRAFELGLLALYELSKRISDVEVIFAGWDVSNYNIPFKHTNLGSVRLEELSGIYAQCDMCLVMSTTNLSLLPLEIMASNAVVVCSKGKNNEWMLNEQNAILVPYDSLEIANQLEYYLKNKEKLDAIRERGRKFAQGTDWEKEAEKVYNIMIKGIEEDRRKKGR